MAVIGCGRIGSMHCDNISSGDRFDLVSVHDINRDAAERIGARHGARIASTTEKVMEDPDIQAVLIASSTATHADLIEQSVASGKAVFCEKPIDLSLARAEACERTVAPSEPLVQLGFNRRFDPGHAAAQEAASRGDIGEIIQVVITSRDPAPPPREYLEICGGLFRDMTIHDFDMASFMLGETPVEVFAVADPLIDPDICRELEEVDVAMIILRTATGKTCFINNSRQAPYGYDQRVELLGRKGMLVSENRKPHETRSFGAESVESSVPYHYFFIERYKEAFLAQLDSFADSIEKNKPCAVGIGDGVNALRLAEAAYLSLAERRLVSIEEVSSK